MKTLHRLTIALLFSVLFIMAQRASAQEPWSPQSAKKWVNGREWANGLKLKAHASVNAVEFAKQYQANKAAWDKAFTFLGDKKLDTLPPGKYIIDGDNIYAMITEAPSKDFDKSAWESHRKYIDLQYVIRGKEKIGVAPVILATVVNPYDDTKDIANYNTEGKFYVAEPGTFFLFFPGDAHRPNIKVDGYDVVKKIVIKIKYINQ